MFGFEIFKNYLYNVKHTLILTRGSNTLPIFNNDATLDGKVVLKNIVWKVPEVKLNNKAERDAVAKLNAKTIRTIDYTKRSDNKFEIPAGVTTHTYKLSVAGGIEKPRWIIIAFQTDRIGTQQQNPAVFDHINLKSASLRLHSEMYPKQPFKFDFNVNNYSEAYEAMDKFKKEHFGYNSLIGGTQISFANYKQLYPFIVFDVTRQSDEKTFNSIDVQVNFEFGAAVPADTIAYAIILSDSLYALEADGSEIRRINK